MTKEELKQRVCAELLTDKTPTELSKKYGIPYATVQSWNKKVESEATETTISDVVSNNTLASLEVIRETAKREAPRAAEKIDDIMDGVVGLKTIEPQFREAMSRAVEVAKEFLNDKDDEGKSRLTVKEWQALTSTLSSAYAALFNKAGTTVNVAQTNVSTDNENLQFFKASQRNI